MVPSEIGFNTEGRLNQQCNGLKPMNNCIHPTLTAIIMSCCLLLLAQRPNILLYTTEWSVSILYMISSGIRCFSGAAGSGVQGGAAAVVGPHPVSQGRPAIPGGGDRRCVHALQKQGYPLWQGSSVATTSVYVHIHLLTFNLRLPSCLPVCQSHGIRLASPEGFTAIAGVKQQCGHFVS